MFKSLSTLMICICFVTNTYSQTETTPTRPTILFNRWQEDWSVLANPNVPRAPLDTLKYIPLSSTHPHTYLSLGASLRERFESNDAVNFGIDSVTQNYLLSRLETHADLRVADQLQIFMQLQSEFAPGKTIITPVDEDRLSLEQGFIALVEPAGNGLFKFRVGRQQFAFDKQRFVSVRDGPNVRQSFDAIWADYEYANSWRFISFFSHPVVNRNLRVFDDYSSSHYTFGGIRIEHKLSIGKMAAYLAHFKQDDVAYLFVSGNERRDIVDVRFAGNFNSFDWDLEAMGQVGTIANNTIRAWATGSIIGYQFQQTTWQPRLGLQVDAASGNQHSNSHTLGTFNPLFPNGQYFTLAGYTGYTNLIHLKPTLSFNPLPSLTTLLAIAAQWRETTADAVYTQPDNAVPGTEGVGSRYTGTYFQGRLDWKMTRYATSAIEIVRFNVAQAIRQAGGRNANYVGVEIKLGW